MAKIKRRNVDSLRPVRKSSYEAPSIRRRRVPPEYTKLDRAPKRHTGLIFLFLVFLAAVGGFFFWSQRQTTVVKESLEMQVTGPDKAVAGDQVTYKVVYKNTDVVTLQKMELSVRWPSGFYFDQATIDPRDQNATTWVLDDLAAGQQASLEISGQLVGKTDEIVTAYFNLSYEPENFTSAFKVKQNIDTKITDNKIDLVIDSVDKTLVSTDLEMKIKFINLSKEALSELYMDILLPDDLTVASIEPGKGEEKYWPISLEAGEEKEVLIKGQFAGDSKPEQLLIAEIGSLSDENFRRLARVEQRISVISPKFGVKLQITGQDKFNSASWSDVLRYSLEVTNQSGVDMPDVMISALLDGTSVNWNTLETSGQASQNSITWTKQQDNTLENWTAGETKAFTWQIKVVDNPQPDRTIENIIKIDIEGLANWEQIEPPYLLTIGESISFNAGIYWDLAGRRVGSGLLPPKVGESTDYLAVWSLPEATGDFDSIRVETTLPPEVEFISETDVQGGSLDFDEASRTLVWSIADFENKILPLTASFIIELVPTSQFQGQSMTLMNPITLTADGIEDVVVKSKLIKTTDVYANSTDPIGIIR